MNAVTLDDLEIRTEVCGRRHYGREVCNIRKTACLFQLLIIVELIGKRHDIDGLARIEYRAHGADDELVRFLIKVVFGQFVEDIRLDFVVDQQTTEQRLLRLEIVRQYVCLRHLYDSFSLFRRSFFFSRNRFPVVRNKKASSSVFPSSISAFLTISACDTPIYM